MDADLRSTGFIPSYYDNNQVDKKKFGEMEKI